MCACYDLDRELVLYATFASDEKALQAGEHHAYGGVVKPRFSGAPTPR
jgi:hypothetical protein